MPPQCMGWNSGYLCAVDYGVPGSALNVQGNNPNWGAFGWNDRADAFYNGGKVCGVTIYDGINYTDPAFYLVRGLSFVGWSNKARGNKWC